MKKKCFHAKSVPTNIIMTYNGAHPGGRQPISYSALSSTPINVLALAFAQFKPQGGVDLTYLIGTNVVLNTAGITQYKNATGGIVLLSFGGGNTPFSMTVDPATWAQNTVNELTSILPLYNLDGIDIDIEHGLGEAGHPEHYIALNSLNAALKSLGYIISMAPQCTQIYPQKIPPVIDNTWNTYMPLYSTLALANVDIIAPQFYNNCPCEYNMPICGPAETYLQWIQLIQTGWTATYEGPSYTARFSDSDLRKILIGKPGALDAAGSGYQSPTDLVAIYKGLVDAGKYLGGFMYWSAEYDAPSFPFADTLDRAFWAS